MTAFVTGLLARRRRSGDLASRLEALETVTRLGAGGFSDQSLAAARAVLDRAGGRLRLSVAHTVVAVAGGTGSGKSSLVNAIAGEQVTRAGVRRPTTGEAVAAVWGEDGAGPLLDWLGIRDRHTVGGGSAGDTDLDGLVLLDLPDHDSTEVRHRLEVDRLVDLVDLLVWVVDPQKYADAALHERYLQPLRSHRSVMVVVLNQIDLLPPAGVEDCVRDLRRLLNEDGLGDLPLVPASAATGQGVPELREVLADAVRRRTAATERLTADVDRVVGALQAELGPSAPGEPGTVGRAERARLHDALATAAGVPVVEQAVAQAVRRGVHASTGWPFTRWAGRLRRDPLARLHLTAPDARSSLPPASPVARAAVDVAVRGVADSAAADLPEGWADCVRDASRARIDDLDDALDRAMATGRPELPRRRLWEPVLGFLQLLLALVAVAGLLWLAALFAVDWARLPEPPTKDIGRIPLPTLLLVGGVLAGLLVALLGRTLGRVSARRAARHAGAALREAVTTVGEELVIEPVKDELQRYAVVREALRRAE